MLISKDKILIKNKQKTNVLVIKIKSIIPGILTTFVKIPLEIIKKKKNWYKNNPLKAPNSYLKCWNSRNRRDWNKEVYIFQFWKVERETWKPRNIVK